MKIVIIFTKTLLVLCAVVSFAFYPAYVRASVYGDTYYTYTCADGEGYLHGLGITVTNDLPVVFNIRNAMWYVSSSLSYGQKDANRPWNTSRLLLPVTAGLYSEYTFSSYPFKVGGGAGCGAVYIRKYTPKHYGPYMDFSQTEVHNAIGPRIEAIMGIGYIITQKTSFFIKAGYQLSWFDAQYIEKNTSGYMIHCGLQWTLQGTNKGLFDE